MGLFDFVNKNKQKQLNDAKILIQDAKIEEQKAQIRKQQEQIEAIVKKVKSVDKKVIDNQEKINKMREEQNKCISTYGRYEPSSLSRTLQKLKIRRLSQQSEYNYIISLVCELNNKDEFILGQFNKGSLKIIQEKFENVLEFQENLQFGGIDKEAILEEFKRLEEYASNNEIVITPEGKQILANSKNEPLNISKTILYVGDSNIVEKVEVKGNEDILHDIDNYSTDELSRMREADKIVKNVVTLNKQDNIEELIINNKELLETFFDNNPEIKRTYDQIHRDAIENDIFLNSIKYLNEQEKNFDTTNEYNYIKLYSLGRTEEATEFYKKNNLDISKIKAKISKNDNREDISKKFQINRLFSYKHKQNTIGFRGNENEIYESFLDSIAPDENYEMINTKRKEEKIYLASIIDREKTEMITEKTDQIKDFNTLLRRQDFEDRINYEISDNEDNER